MIVVLDEAYRSAAVGRFAGHEVRFFPSDHAIQATFAEIIRPATALGLRRPLSFPFDGQVVEAAHDLQFIQKSGSGIDWFDIEALNRLGILLAVNSGVNAVSVAEHTLMLALTCLRGGFGSMQAMRDGVWERTATALPPVLLDGKIVGILGMGAIGTRVARAMSGLGARVLATRPPRDGVAEAAVVSLDELLREADIITLHVPLTDETRGMIGPRELALMKPGVVLINTSRGQVIDEDALYVALRDGRLRAAGLDVFQQEPTPPENPLLALDNVYATPHIGGLAQEINARQVEGTLSNIERFLAGEMPEKPVNPEVLASPRARATHLRAKPV